MRLVGKNVKWLGVYIICWLFWMALSRLTFGIYNLVYHQHISIADFLKSFLYGCYMDLSMVGYLLVFILLLLSLFNFTKYSLFLSFIRWFSYFLLVVFSLLNSVDTVLYKDWGYKLDATPLFYLHKAGEVLNFVSLTNSISTLVIFIFLLWGGIYLFNRFSFKSLFHIRASYINGSISFILIPFMIIPIRGGFGLAPMNLSKVYFSGNIFSNHMAVNTIWNILYSLTEEKDLKSKYEFLPEEEANRIVSELYKNNDDTSSIILNTTKPDILFIILESFTGKIIDYKLNGIEVTPNLNKWSKDELYFSNMYASADRTDEGLVAWFSGFPSQPKSAIMNYPDKCSKLPSIVKPFKALNYNTKFLYGGDISFANMGSYLMLMGFDTLVDKSAFPRKSYNAKWGVHDHILFEKLYAELGFARSPYFYSCISLSSHPPYDIPVQASFKGLDEETLFLNTMHYTDNALGLMIEKLKQSANWKNMLVIITADHGARQPLNSEYFEPSRFKIPMIWMGGALKTRFTYSKICSQTDFGKTLLSQTSKASKEFIFANNLFSKSSNEFAWYAYNNGFTYISNKGAVSYSNDSQSVITRSDSTEQSLKNGKAILQVVTDKFYKY